MTTVPVSRSALVERGPAALLVVDGRARVVEANERAERLLGLAPGTGHGTALFERLRVAAEPREELERWLAGGAEGSRAARGEADGRPVRAELARISDDGARIGVLLVDAEEEARARRREAAVLRALEELRRSTSDLAHEIKNPITAVHLALRAAAESLGEDHQVVLRDLVARMRGLETRLRRALDLVKPLELRPRACAPRELLAGALEELRSAAGAREIALDLDAGDAPALQVDPALVREALAQLVANAIAAAPHRGRVLARATREDGVVVLAVEDDGPGIPPRMRAEVLRPFATTRADGDGLGLAIARKIALEHDGELRIDESDLGGARVSLRLPTRSA